MEQKNACRVGRSPFRLLNKLAFGLSRTPPHIDEGGGVKGGGLEERVMNQKNAVVGRGYLFSV